MKKFALFLLPLFLLLGIATPGVSHAQTASAAVPVVLGQSAVALTGPWNSTSATILNGPTPASTTRSGRPSI